MFSKLIFFMIALLNFEPVAANGNGNDWDLDEPNVPEGYDYPDTPICSSDEGSLDSNSDNLPFEHTDKGDVSIDEPPIIWSIAEVEEREERKRKREKNGTPANPRKKTKK